MSFIRNLISSALLAGLAAGSALAQAQGGRGGGGAGGEGPFAAVAPGANQRLADEGCYRPGDTVTIDWQGLARFDGELRVVTDGGHAPLAVTSWTGRAVMVRLEGVAPGRTYPVVWTSAAEVQAKIGELSTCAAEG